MTAAPGAAVAGRRFAWRELERWRWGPMAGKPLPPAPPPRTGPREPGDDDEEDSEAEALVGAIEAAGFERVEVDW